jgi:hypothetical protein
MRNEIQHCHDKRTVNKKEDLFFRKLDLNLRKNQGNATFEAWLSMMINLGKCGK